MNEETREALDAQSVDMDRIKDDIRGLQEDVRLVLNLCSVTSRQICAQAAPLHIPG